MFLFSTLNTLALVANCCDYIVPALDSSLYNFIFNDLDQNTESEWNLNDYRIE